MDSSRLSLSRLGLGATGLDLLQSSATACELFLYGFDSRGPDEGFWVCIPCIQKRIDGRFQVRYAVEDAATDSLVIEVSEPSFDKIQPTGTGGNEVRHEPRIPFQPGLYFGVLVCVP